MGKKIRIGDIEGDSDALTSFFATSDCSLGEYLNANKRPKMDCRLLIGEVILFLIFLSILWSTPSSSIVCKKICILVSLALVGCTPMFIHLYWRNRTVTIIGAVTSFVLFMVALDAMTPEEAGRKINDSIEQIK